jgi:cytochrome P450 family 9
MDLFTLTAIGVCFYLFYKWATANNDYFVAKGVKFTKPIFLLGSNASIVTQKQSLVEMATSAYNAFPAEK